MEQNGSTDQSDEILATSGKFVPTASRTPAAAVMPIVSRAAVSSGPQPTHRDRSDVLVDWQTAMKRAVRDSSRLRELLGLDGDDGHRTVREPGSTLSEVEGENRFPTFVPLEFLRRIRKGDPHDPLLRQVLPVAAEDFPQPGDACDPVGDLDSMAAPGLLQKYHGRALMLVSAACGVHCRYCFRREYPYHQDSGPSDHWDGAIDYLRHQPGIDEVLLSGGDPLTRTDETLDRLIGRLESLPHLRRLRIHTRMPIVIPQRVTESLVDRLAASRLAVWMVVHANHPRELDDQVLDALARLIDRGIPVLNQTVLLRGVNDDATTLIELSRRLIDHRIQPYYLHQLDRVRGAAHFEVSVETGRLLVEQMRNALPGYAVPTYVVEQAGEPSKTPVAERTLS